MFQNDERLALIASASAVQQVGPGENASRLQKRNILYIETPGTPDIFQGRLRKSGWNPLIVDDIRKAGELISNKRALVGLVTFGTRTRAGFLRELEGLLTLNGVNWIGLLPSDWDGDDKAWDLIEDYFFDYFKLPLDFSRLKIILGHAHGMAQLASRHNGEHAPIPDNEEILGASPAIQLVKRRLHKIATVDAPLVIWGESGTGKELVARAVHLHSPRANGPFEAVNCAALPASLIQSELFGHEKGSFTGADRCKIGLFEAASGGTIFLDEIGDLSPELQVILLRVLEQKVMRRVGGTRDIPIDVRVVAATHVDLQKAVANNVFREDLYYRLNVLHLDIPPLRDRAEDIELIAKHYLEQFSSKNNPRVRGFSEGALEVMNYHPWPGNVRELINRVHQATILAEGRMIGASDLGLERRGADRDKMTLDEIRDSAEKTAIAAALARARNNVSRAARDLGISRTTMYRFMEKHSIRT